MTDRTKQERSDAARKGHHACVKCGNINSHEVDGADCGGFPGIRYKVCVACGYAAANPKIQRKARSL